MLHTHWTVFSLVRMLLELVLVGLPMYLIHIYMVQVTSTVMFVTG